MVKKQTNGFCGTVTVYVMFCLQLLILLKHQLFFKANVKSWIIAQAWVEFSCIAFKAHIE